jgi:PhnB protein
MRDEEAIRAVLEARRSAVAAKDAPASVRDYAEDVVLFDLQPPLAQPSGAATDPAGAAAWFATWDGPIGVELRELVIRAEGNLAFACGFLHMAGQRADGSPESFWSRTTIGLEKRDGAWRIVHEHNSFPMLMDGSRMAATDLSPDGDVPL